MLAGQVVKHVEQFPAADKGIPERESHSVIRLAGIYDDPLSLALNGVPLESCDVPQAKAGPIGKRHSGLPEAGVIDIVADVYKSRVGDEHVEEVHEFTVLCLSEGTADFGFPLFEGEPPGMNRDLVCRVLRDGMFADAELEEGGEDTETDPAGTDRGGPLSVDKIPNVVGGDRAEFKGGELTLLHPLIDAGAVVVTGGGTALILLNTCQPLIDGLPDGKLGSVQQSGHHLFGEDTGNGGLLQLLDPGGLYDLAGILKVLLLGGPAAGLAGGVLKKADVGTIDLFQFHRSAVSGGCL